MVRMSRIQLCIVAALLGKGRPRVSLITWQHHSFCSSNVSKTYLALNHLSTSRRTDLLQRRLNQKHVIVAGPRLIEGRYKQLDCRLKLKRVALRIAGWQRCQRCLERLRRERQHLAEMRHFNIKQRRQTVCCNMARSSSLELPNSAADRTCSATVPDADGRDKMERLRKYIHLSRSSRSSNVMNVMPFFAAISRLNLFDVSGSPANGDV